MRTKKSRKMQLNMEALRIIRKHLDWGTMWQRKLFIELTDARGIFGSPMKIATMKLNAVNFKLYEKNKQEAIAEHREGK